MKAKTKSRVSIVVPDQINPSDYLAEAARLIVMSACQADDQRADPFVCMAVANLVRYLELDE